MSQITTYTISQSFAASNQSACIPPVQAPGGQPANDDGIFWMAWRDVRLYFTAVAVCRVRRGWQEFRVPVQVPPPCEMAPTGYGGLNPVVGSVFWALDTSFLAFRST